MKRVNLLQVVAIISAIFIYQNTFAQCGSVGKGTNGGIKCIYSDTVHNRLYMGGGFKSSGNTMMNHCSYWDSTDYVAMGMNGVNGCNDSVWCFTYFNGSLYAGGKFTQAGGIMCNHIARWNGTSWFAIGDGFNESVHTIAIYNNELYAGGDFTTSGSIPVSHLGKWNGTQWVQVDGGVNDDVDVMCVWNNMLYIGGDFTMAGGNTANRICKWDGNNFSSVGSGFTTGMMGECMVHSLCVYNGNLYAGGMFEHGGAMNMRNVGMWNGSEWSSIGDIGGAMMGENVVSAMCVYNNKLFIGGNFGTCGSRTANNLGVWDGLSWSTIGTGMNGEVNSMTIYNDGLYIVGSFSNAAGVLVNNITKYSLVSGIQPLQSDINLFSVFPNPANDNITITFDLKESVNLVIDLNDVLGKQVAVITNGKQTGAVTKQFSTYSLPDGNYLLRFQVNGQNYIQKLSVIH
ncbi:MAG: T9SS type A sorting domain-containing protein [Bacteroidetes bacterium]|nr:T9SS type A sorting domain-containing protein [Bacteroidota bacterium]